MDAMRCECIMMTGSGLEAGLDWRLGYPRVCVCVCVSVWVCVWVCVQGGVHIREMKRGGPLMASEMPPC